MNEKVLLLWLILARVPNSYGFIIASCSNSVVACNFAPVHKGWVWKYLQKVQKILSRGNRLNKYLVKHL